MIANQEFALCDYKLWPLPSTLGLFLISCSLPHTWTHTNIHIDPKTYIHHYVAQVQDLRCRRNTLSISHSFGQVVITTSLILYIVIKQIHTAKKKAYIIILLATDWVQCRGYYAKYSIMWNSQDTCYVCTINTVQQMKTSIVFVSIPTVPKIWYHRLYYVLYLNE